MGHKDYQSSSNRQNRKDESSDVDVVGENTIVLPRKTISLCAVMSVMIALMAVAIAVATFTPTYLQCNKATQDIAASLRSSIISDVTARIEDFFSAPLRTTLTLRAMLDAKILLPWNLTEAESIGLVSDILIADTSGSSQQVYLWIPQAGKAYTALASLLAPEPGIIYIAKLMSLMGPFNGYRMNVSTRVIDYSVAVQSLPIPGPLLYYFPSFQDVLKIPPGQLWGLPAAAYSEMHFGAGMLLTDPQGHIGSLGASVKPSKTSAMLAQLKLGPSARAVLVHKASGWLFGNSWGEPLTILNTTVIQKPGNVTLQQYQDLTAKDALRMTFLYLSNMTDPLMVTVLRKYSQAFLLSVPTPFSVKFGVDADEIALDVISITDEYGLNLRVIIAEPLRDFVGDLYTTRNAVAGAVFGAVLVVIVIGAAFSMIVINPLKMLGIRMQLQAHLQDVDDDYDDNSMLTEVAAVQGNFAAMKNELDRVKRYLPESIAVRRHEEEEPQDDEDNPTPLASKDSTDNLSASTSSAFSHENPGSPAATKLRRGSMVICNKLNIERALTKRSVTIAVFNAARWHPTIVAMSPQECMDFHADYLRDVLAAIAAQRGTVDFFQGDHVVASFNAVKFVRKHAQCATAAALVAVDAVQRNAQCAHTTPALYVGIASGVMLCGNAGSESMSRFTLTGAAYSDACRLERASRNYTATHVLVSDTVEHGVGGSLTMEAVGVMRLSPTADAGSAPRVVYKVHPRSECDASPHVDTGVVMPYSASRTERDELFLCVNASFQLIAAHMAASGSPTGRVASSGALERGHARVDLLTEIRRRLADIERNVYTASSAGAASLQQMLEYCGDDEAKVDRYFVEFQVGLVC